MIAQVLFAVVLVAAIVLFMRNARRIARNIHLGRSEARNDRKGERWALMTRVAFGQSKMVVRPVAGVLHIIVYAGFVIINIEVLEILIDGLFGCALKSPASRAGRSPTSRRMNSTCARLFIGTKESLIAVAVYGSSNDSRSITWHQWHAE